MATISNPTPEGRRAPDADPNPARLPAVPQSQRLETMGRLTSGVAHDFANLLTLIAGYSDIMLARVGEQDGFRQQLEEISRAANRGARLTSQLLGFSRGQAASPNALDLNELVNESVGLLRPVIGENIHIETVLAPGLGRIYADAGQMEQVLMNLILNARDAMPQGGSVRIETSNGYAGEGPARGHALEPGAKVLLTVSDTGFGMDAQTLAHAFEPFFTTKEPGKGTGLGLHTVQRVVRQSGGDIWVRSTPGEGASFTICLPRMPEIAGIGSGSSSVRRASAGDETILVVEDEDAVRRLIGHVLRLRGYRVIEAANAEEALGIFAARGSEVHLVLTDMVMPGKSGSELAELLLKMRPGTRLVFMSGYTDEVLLRTGALRPGMCFLQKPMRPEMLAAKVRETLDSPPQPFNPR